MKAIYGKQNSIYKYSFDEIKATVLSVVCVAPGDIKDGDSAFSRAGMEAF